MQTFEIQLYLQVFLLHSCYTIFPQYFFFYFFILCFHSFHFCIPTIIMLCPLSFYVIVVYAFKWNKINVKIFLYREESSIRIWLHWGTMLFYYSNFSNIPLEYKCASFRDSRKAYSRFIDLHPSLCQRNILNYQNVISSPIEIVARISICRWRHHSIFITKLRLKIKKNLPVGGAITFL